MEHPAIATAKRFHLSGVGLAKVCEKHGVPRPGVGHWAKVQWGQSPEQTPLPDCEDRELKRIEFRSPRETKQPQPERRPEDPELSRRITEEEDPANRIVVPDRVGSLYPLVQGLKQPSRQDRGRNPHPITHYTSFFRVSREQFDRGRRLLSTLFKAAEDRGCRLETGDDRWHGEVRVHLLDATFYLSLREPAKRQSIPESERKRSYERHRYTASGKLELHVGDLPRSHSPKVWRDLKKKPLEERLNEIVIAWLEGVERQRNERAEQERWQAEYRERQLRAQQEALQQQREQARVEHLHALHNAWRDAGSLRAFLQELEEHLNATEELLISSEWQTWLQWARDYSERLDPLRGNRSLLDQAISEPPSSYRRRPR